MQFLDSAGIVIYMNCVYFFGYATKLFNNAFFKKMGGVLNFYIFAVKFIKLYTFLFPQEAMDK